MIANVVRLNTERMKTDTWINYSERKPNREGMFFWRVPHVNNGYILQFKARMRLRGAGYENVLSFFGDHWDGYQVTVPEGLQWREIISGDPELIIEGFKADCCPFCSREPVIHSSDGFICALPFQHRKLSIKCCYAAVSYFTDWSAAFKAWNTRKVAA